MLKCTLLPHFFACKKGEVLKKKNFRFSSTSTRINVQGAAWAAGTPGGRKGIEAGAAEIQGKEGARRRVGGAWQAGCGDRRGIEDGGERHANREGREDRVAEGQQGSVKKLILAILKFKEFTPLSTWALIHSFFHWKEGGFGENPFLPLKKTHPKEKQETKQKPCEIGR